MMGGWNKSIATYGEGNKSYFNLWRRIQSTMYQYFECPCYRRNYIEGINANLITRCHESFRYESKDMELKDMELKDMELKDMLAQSYMCLG
jgi:hypothetical protein